MAWARSMGMIRSRESEFGRASSGPTSPRHRATGSKRPRQTRARPGRQTGCRTSHEFANRGDRQIGKMALKETTRAHLFRFFAKESALNGEEGEEIPQLLFARIRSLQTLHINLDHLHHGLQHSLRLLRILVAQ